MCISIGFNKTRRPSRPGEREGHIIETTCVGCDDELFVHIRFVLFVIVEYLFEFPIDVHTT